MGFLTPLFLIALAGLAGPILLHLTRRERGRPIRFPSLMFLRRIPFQESARRRIRHWLLLCLRLAALALLVAAFARPFARGGRLASIGEGVAEEVVILLDRSWSMEAGNRWEEARSQAREAVGALGSQDRISLIAFAETPALLHRSIPDAARILSTLDTLTTGSLATRMAPAIKLAASTLATSELTQRRIVLISDFQRSAWEADPDAKLPEGVVLESVVIGDEATANLILTDPELGREGTGGRERLTARARLVNTGREAATAEVALLIDETGIHTLSAEVAGGGATVIEFEPFTLTEPFTRGEIQLLNASAEELAQDNKLHFVASPGGETNIVIVDPAGMGDSNLYLRGALGIAEGSGFATRVVRNVPNANALDVADVVILNGGPLPGGDAGDRLRDFVEGGGGLLMALGERSTAASVHADFLPGTIGAVAERSDERHLGFVDYDHAIFEAFRGPRSGDFSQAAFYRTRSVTPTDGQVLARFDDGSAALIEGRRGTGRILIWTTGLDRFWNNLPLQPIYLPFLHRLAHYLGGRGELPPWHLAGSTVNLPALAEATGSWEVPPGAVAMEPGGGSVPLDDALATLTLDRAGIWEIRSPGLRAEHPFAIAANVDVAESELTRMDVEAFRAAVGGAVNAARNEDDTRNAEAAPTNDEMERAQSLWRYLLAAAFLLLIAETIVANRLSRERTQEE